MEFIMAVITAIFVALLIGTVLTFGFAILTFAAFLAVGLTALLTLRNALRRWQFLRGAQPPRPAKPIKPNPPPYRQPPRIIDAEYEEIGRDKPK